MSNSSGKFSFTEVFNQFMASCLVIAAILALLLCINEMWHIVFLSCSILTVVTAVSSLAVVAV